MATPNPAQQAAIACTDGPLLIIAGPGSGKTYTLVERIVHLIRDHGVAPESLFIVSFTDKAAQELVTRVTRRLSEEGIAINLDDMYLGTFHAICLRLLDEHREHTRLKRSYTLPRASASTGAKRSLRARRGFHAGALPMTGRRSAVIEYAGIHYWHGKGRTVLGERA